MSSHKFRRAMTFKSFQREPYYYLLRLLDPIDNIYVVYYRTRSPKAIGMAHRDCFSHNLIIRKSFVEYDLLEEKRLSFFTELDVAEALQTGINIDDWSK